ncbi:4Fe-4S binding domain protein [uncultured Desulfatiglans sp.]|uniref:4Fe-4S binding domain protein n=1 Tax=Uncultured Desulfatiglans sp. TaxID=1748965 RepID=A0A653A7D2_UNCDX|nr:4Fe-4S binding domain protein [uncultured Desulfatiglans sp.]
MVTIIVDDTEIQAEEGANLLEVCLDNGIFIPNLCHIPGQSRPRASCRMCFVEIEGVGRPITSCTETVRDGMRVRTGTERVRRLQRAGLQFLLSVHDVDCGHCPSNKHCPLQDTARFLKAGLKSKKLDKILSSPPVIREHPLLDYYPNRCILCGKCLDACRRKMGQPLLTFAKRGFETIISFFGEKERTALACGEEPACAAACPVSAIRLHSAGEDAPGA